MRHALLLPPLLILSACLSLCTAQQATKESEIYEKYSLQLASKQLNKQEYKNAIETLDKYLKIAQTLDDTNAQYKGYALLGEVYLTLQDTLRSKEVFEKASILAQELQNDTLLADTYLNLGKVYTASTSNQERGIQLLKKSTALNTRLGRPDASLTSNIYLGRIYLDQDNLDEAYPVLMKAKITSLKDTTAHKDRSQILTLLGRYYTRTKRYTLAETELLNAVDIAFNHGLIAEEEEAQEQLAAYYETVKNFEAAFYHSQRQLQLDEELFKNESHRELQLASAQFDFRENERDLLIAKREKELTDKVARNSLKTNTALIVASSVLLIGLFIIFLMYKARKKYSLRLREKNRELIIAKNQAEHLSKLKTQFFSTISHELRTPLYGVIGIASILLEDKKIKTHRDDLKSLKFSADYLLALINDVLLMSKMEAKDIRLEHTPFKLTTLLKSITRSFEFSLEQNKNKLHLEIDPEIPNEFIGDSVRLSQILMNLIGNAIKFNENGNIWVLIQKEAVTEDGLYQLKFSIKDDGIGIPKASQKSIFEEFSQVENKNYNYQGTGLGLPIVKKLLTLFNSDIELESEEGQGATFSFIIALEKAEGASAISQKEVAALEIVNTPISRDAHILVVDDNRINQKITQKLLESKGFTCSLASDGVEAISMAKSDTYDLILMDIHMPNKDGIEATQEIRAFDLRTSIIALTAVEIDEIKHKIYESGMDDILIKPYDVSHFLNIVLRHIKNKRAPTIVTVKD